MEIEDHSRGSTRRHADQTKSIEDNLNVRPVKKRQFGVIPVREQKFRSTIRIDLQIRVDPR